ncbi:MAG: class I SAM-dependent methyltransferase [Actinomycetota bacterium]|nr:class I SAM-dependent methyltransferase [Actinomycetota bacterium]MDA8166196.1 class I SAM-dependent methyltransferase [Actinomycetota bacterium]
MNKLIKSRNVPVACALCGGRDERRLFPARDKMFPGRERFSAVRCRRCGLVYLNPRPSPQSHAAAYGRRYFFSAENADQAQPVEHYWPVVRFLEEQEEPGRLLDIGTGNSPFLPLMRERGWQVAGTEVDASLVQYFRQQHGIGLHCGELQDAGLEGGSFDAVTIMGVLEHVSDPLSLLEEADRILARGGVIGLWCFNRSIEARLLGRFWLGFDAPRHLYSFSRRTLEQLLERAGFAVEQVYFRPVNYLAYSGMWAAARMRDRLSGSGRPVYVPRLPALLEKLSLPLGVALARSGASSNMYVLARKRNQQ